MIATGLGSLPGTDMGAAIRRTLGELPVLGYLPELPARGPGADMVGRMAAQLVDMPVELSPRGWRLCDASSRVQRRAIAMLRSDLDLLEEAAADYPGQLKVSFAGPWTLASRLELPNGNHVLSDVGAVRELVASLAAGLAGLAGDIGARLPGHQVSFQLDEPCLPAVATGQVAMPSGYRRYPAVEPALLSAMLSEVVGVFGSASVVVHCCAPGLDLGWLSGTGVRGISVDAHLLTAQQWDGLGGWLDAGHDLWLGAVPTHMANVVPSVDDVVGALQGWLRPLGLDPAMLDAHLVLTPACGLASWASGAADELVRQLVRAAQLGVQLGA